MCFKPMINDITTTPEAPPAFSGAAGPYPPGNAAVQRCAYPDLAPLALAFLPGECFKRAAAAARAMPRWEVAAEDPGSGRIEAVATTLLLRYKDDIVIEVRPAPGGCAVHMRSKSRLGRGDFGANAKRIRAYLAALAGTP